MAVRLFVLLVVTLLVAGCGQPDSPVERQQRQKPSAEQGSNKGSSPTPPKFDPKGVGDTVGVGSFLVTLNDAKASSGDNQDEGAAGHY